MRHRIWALVLVLLLMCPASWSAGTERSLDRSALKQAERHILAMFGLDSRPTPSKTNKTVSSYVKALYERQSRTGSPDTIRCFKGRDIGVKNGCDPFRVKYQFDLAGVPDSEELWAAELVLYREGEAAELRPSVHRVQVHDIMQPATQESDSRMRLLDVKIFQGTLSGSWETFDVLPAVRRWLEQPSQNFGLFIELVSSLKRDGLQSVRLKRNIDEDQEEWSQYEPLLVLYSRDPNVKPASVLSRTKRSTSKKKHRRKGVKNNCRRHALYVDFNDVGWDDWIIAPPGYNAYFCHGDCPFPLPDHLNATNHAIVQTLVNSSNPPAVPKACCVPSELSSISMLYKDKNDNVVLHTYRDMVVEGCGCR